MSKNEIKKFIVYHYSIPIDVIIENDNTRNNFFDSFQENILCKIDFISKNPILLNIFNSYAFKPSFADNRFVIETPVEINDINLESIQNALNNYAHEFVKNKNDQINKKRNSLVEKIKSLELGIKKASGFKSFIKSKHKKHLYNLKMTLNKELNSLRKYIENDNVFCGGFDNPELYLEYIDIIYGIFKELAMNRYKNIDSMFNKLDCNPDILDDETFDFIRFRNYFPS